MCNCLYSNIIRKEVIVRFVKAKRISWIGHVERMEDSRNAQESDERENLHQEKKG
jgi:hypothetical protein